jgi:hypothetical protein
MSSNSGDDELSTPSIDAIESRPPAENTAKKQRLSMSGYVSRIFSTTNGT